jgi:UPF0271 protein
MVKYGRVRTVDGIMIKVAADTICVHGDGANAIEIAKQIHQSLTAAGIEVAPPSRHK